MNDPLAAFAHRPWPLPAERWTMAMRWHDLLFAHWPVRPEVLRPLVPAGLEIDTHDGWAWLGIVPFRMSGIRLRYAPRACAWAFAELNVRTYVRGGGKAGVWFFSLDAAHRLAVRVARAWYGLPYFNARINFARQGEGIHYASERVDGGASAARLTIDYQPSGPVFQAQCDTLEHWLIERYCLFAQNRRGQLGCAEVQHTPWPLQLATAEIAVNTMLQPLGINLPATPPLLHFARDLDVVAWRVKKLPTNEKPSTKRASAGCGQSP